jgi:hypothetical protein
MYGVCPAGIELDQSTVLDVVQRNVERVEEIRTLNPDQNDVRMHGGAAAAHKLERLIHAVARHAGVDDAHRPAVGTQPLLNDLGVRFAHTHPWPKVNESPTARISRFDAAAPGGGVAESHPS